MDILITGGAGFIGSHLAKSMISKGHKVTIIDNFSNGDLRNIWNLISQKKLTLVKGDIRDKNILNDITINTDAIFHLAAQIHIDKSVLDPQETIDTNVTGTLNILELALKRDFEKIVFASTSEVYGTAQKDKIDENHPLCPQSPYAASKVAGDRLCHSYHQTYGLNVTIMRSFNTYGPFQKDTGYGSVIPIFIKRVLNNKPPIIYGSGEQTRDFMFIEDAINAYNLILKNTTHGDTFNFGSGVDISVKDLAKKIIDLCGSNLEPVFVEQRAGEVMKLCADTSKAKKILGFEPKYTLDDGLKTYIDWFKKYKFDEWKMG